jgi:hypothetical protein
MSDPRRPRHIPKTVMKMTDVVGLIDEKAAEVAIVRRVYKERDDRKSVIEPRAVVCVPIESRTTP